MTADIDAVLSGKPGDPLPPPGRENFNARGLNAWLDSNAGQVLVAQWDGRQAAAQALADAAEADRAWRRQQAIPRAEQFPGRFPSVDDAANAIGDPAGGPSAVLGGMKVKSRDIADAARRADPSKPWHVIEEMPDASVHAISQGPGTGGPHLADTRPPWARGG